MRATPDDTSFQRQGECEALFERALLADAEATATLYRRCVPPLRNWLRAHMPGCEAEDLAHEALLAALRHGARLWKGGCLASWLKTIAWQSARKRLRSEMRRRRREREYVEHESRMTVSAPEASSTRKSALHRCLARLPAPKRRLLRLHYLEGRSSVAIATDRGRSRSAVAVSLHRICRTLRADIERTLQPRRTQVAA